MCYGARVVKKAKELESHYKIEVTRGTLDAYVELTYNYANGFTHPTLWIKRPVRKIVRLQQLQKQCAKKKIYCSSRRLLRTPYGSEKWEGF